MRSLLLLIAPVVRIYLISIISVSIQHLIRLRIF